MGIIRLESNSSSIKAWLDNDMLVYLSDYTNDGCSWCYRDTDGTCGFGGHLMFDPNNEKKIIDFDIDCTTPITMPKDMLFVLESLNYDIEDIRNVKKCRIMTEEEKAFRELVCKSWDYNDRFYDVFCNAEFREWVFARLNYFPAGLSLWSDVHDDKIVIKAELTHNGRYMTKDDFFNDYFTRGEIKKLKEYNDLADACIEYLKMKNKELYEEIAPYFQK